MTDLTVKLYGPPGTGKTRALTGQLIKSVEAFGPDRVMATTFTRAGADELRQRVAAAYGWALPPDPWRRREFLANRLPWIGTTHSLALKLIDRLPVLKQSDIAEFVVSMGGRANVNLPEVDDLEGYAWAEPGQDEIVAALTVWSAARHRLISTEQAHAQMMWGREGPAVGSTRAQRIIQAYEDFKQQIHKIDFEDMLSLGAREMPPVDVVLADEVQDNSPLLWSCVDAWSTGRYCALAGDPYQAIYLFSGAEPALFINHPGHNGGKPRALGDSHRLTPQSAERAMAILRSGGFHEGEWLGTWTGIGTGEPTDGTEFYLARTSRLLMPVYEALEEMGTPYGYMRGGGPLDTKAADAFRSLMQLRDKGAIPVHAASRLAEQSNTGFPRGMKADLARRAKRDPDTLLTVGELGLADLPALSGSALGIKRGDYFDRVHKRHGMRPFVLAPRVRVGTIHSAKGREADTVHLSACWAFLPYESLMSSREGQQAEACVAYVAATRHRVRLDLSFDWPPRSGYAYPDF